MLVVVTSLQVVSCSDFLDEQPETKLIEEEVFGDEEKLTLMISGLYTQWRETRQDRSMLYLSLGTDEVKQGGQQILENSDQAALDKYNGALSAPNTTVTGEWSKRAKIIAPAAKGVFYAPNDKLKAEAAFLRAAVNFELVQFWGPIPIVDVEDMKYGRQPITAVYPFIIRDLEFAAEHLPATQEDKKMPAKGAAQALLGKIYMYAPEDSGVRDYQKAMEYFDMVIPNYTLIPNYADLFNTTLDQNSSEVIYAFQFRNQDNDNNMVQHHAGSRPVADLDGNTYFGGYDLALPTRYYYEDVWEGLDGDTRKEASLRTDFTLPDGRVPGPSWTGQADELEAHTRKFEDIRTQGQQNFWYSGGLIYYLRLADILLLKAECLNELGNTAEAVNLVNSTVRARAFGGTLSAEEAWPTGMSQEEFRSQIMDERMRELGFEGWRRMDLIRTGNFVSYIQDRNPWANEEGTIQEFHKYWPIPDTEIRLNEYINPEDQNPGY
ncbi:RagB/SusD family nutrient uptake outer membrane protein [Sinomicrobium soli]|nr:RagB/SusD family nutrient uptake outer membrane protein [Sinomicrobium sp. N-1-3-6]